MRVRLPFPVARLSFLRVVGLVLLFVLSGPLGEIAHGQGEGYWHTSGSQILDANNRAVRIAGINWYGFETADEVAQGLYTQDYRSILDTIRGNGYNTVRIPFSNQMVESPIIPFNAISFNNGSPINEDLQGLNSLEILDKIVAYSGEIGLRVILDNHRSEAGNSAESSGLWYTGYYTEAKWISDWQRLALRYRNNPTVIGVDLRNEPHNAASGGACWDCGLPEHDWHLAAGRAGNAVLSINPRLLIFVEGTDSYAGDFTWWGGNLEGVAHSPVNLNLPHQLVYSAHEYGPAEYAQSWFNTATGYNSLAALWSRHWAFISQRDIAPVWLGEFGSGNEPSEAASNVPGSQGQWFQSMIRFLKSNPRLGWTYWAVNGNDAYGLLDQQYQRTPVSELKQNALASVQFPLISNGSQAPETPGALGAAAVSPSQINVKWLPSVSSGVTYNLYASRLAGVSPSAATLIAAGLSTTFYQHQGLGSGTAYHYLVTAVEAGRESVPSEEASAQTRGLSNQATANQAVANQSVSPRSLLPQAEAGNNSISCHVAYLRPTEWNHGFTGALTIYNNSSAALHGWTLSWSWNGTQQLTQAWNARYAQDGSRVTLANMTYNQTIAPNSNIGDIGFNASFNGGKPGPVVFYLNGSRCS